jgi:hypothetical protein
MILGTPVYGRKVRRIAWERGPSTKLEIKFRILGAEQSLQYQREAPLNRELEFSGEGLTKGRVWEE